MEAKELVDTVGAIKAKIDSGEIVGKAALDTAVTELKTALRADQEKRANLAQTRPLGDDERKLSKYLPVDEADIKEQPRSFHVNKDVGGFQVKHAEFTEGKGDSFGLLDDPNPVCDWQKELQGLVTARNIVRAARGNRRGAGDSPISDRRIARHMRSAPDMVKRIFNDSSGVGAEWIDDVMLPDLQRTLELDRRLEANFGVVNVPASGNLLIPFQTTGFRPYLSGTNTTDDPAQYTASSVVTAQRTYAPVKIAVRAVIDEDASEDSLLAAMPLLQAEISKAITDGKEDCIINGDTAATHQDAIASWNARSRWGATGLGGSGDHRKSWIGLRARAYDVGATIDQSAAKTAAGFRAALVAMDSPHFRDDVMCVVSPEYLIETMFGFTQTETLDTFGPGATILSGQLASLYGYPIVVSEFMTNDLHTTGLYTGSSATTGFALVNRSRFRMFRKRGNRVRMATDITRGVVNLVGDERTLFDTFDAAATKNVHFSFNL